MMALQGTTHRSEERFTYDEPVLIIGPGSARTLAQLKDLSLSGAGITVTQGLSGAERVVLRAGGFLSPGDRVKPTVQRRVAG